jgi:hypothetical protein
MTTKNKELFQKLNQETAKISWTELERFFASGNLVLVNQSLDLIDVGMSIAEDKKFDIEKWMLEKNLSPVTDIQAMEWQNEQPTFWALVIKPWVLVQKVNESE